MLSLMPVSVPYLLWENDAFCPRDPKDLRSGVEIDPVSQISPVCKLAAVEGAFSRCVEEIEIVWFVKLRLLDAICSDIFTYFHGPLGAHIS